MSSEHCARSFSSATNWQSMGVDTRPYFGVLFACASLGIFSHGICCSLFMHTCQLATSAVHAL